MTFCSKVGQFATVIFIVLVISSGCSMLPNKSIKTSELPTESTTASAAAPGPAKYFVEIHTSFGQPKLYTGTITEPTTVQQALNKSGALKHLNSPQADLYRLLPGGNPPLKMPVEFKGKQVKYEQDYALHPNDRIIARNKSNSTISDLVDTLTSGR